MTNHRIIFSDARKMCSHLSDNSVDLIVTSPPYPMIQMWDDLFKSDEDMFSSAHGMLSEVWSLCNRVLKPGSIMCINIGDATRNIDQNFKMYDNHSKITMDCLDIGFEKLPSIIWSKPVNSPTKFMGSGMLPCGAYVTLEHEHILIFRKPGKRLFESQEEKQIRKESALFWNERNKWFCDIWKDILGTKQDIEHSSTRLRNASYPFEIPYRLINMFSCKDDLVMDPFSGLFTTSIAAMTSRRNSIGFEIDSDLPVKDNLSMIDIHDLNRIIRNRYSEYKQFLKYPVRNLKHFNKKLNMFVMSNQETEIYFDYIDKIHIIEKNNILNVNVDYSEMIDTENIPNFNVLF